jgi:hypothetical protein
MQPPLGVVSDITLFTYRVYQLLSFIVEHCNASSI